MAAQTQLQPPSPPFPAASCPLPSAAAAAATRVELFSSDCRPPPPPLAASLLTLFRVPGFAPSLRARASKYCVLGGVRIRVSFQGSLLLGSCMRRRRCARRWGCVQEPTDSSHRNSGICKLQHSCSLTSACEAACGGCTQRASARVPPAVLLPPAAALPRRATHLILRHEHGDGQLGV